MAIAEDWTTVLRRYLPAAFGLHLAWEVVQLPLYTIWSDPVSKQAFAVLHCTAGDLMIAGLSLLVALALAATPDWPRSGLRRVWVVLLILGVGYTIYSEWMNVNVRGNWAYAPAMPTLPGIGTGLVPLLQWIVVPTATLWAAACTPPWRPTRSA
ncbi:MAG: hypothetical protein AB7L90_07960 [Hyphomicrobiaceae bacterium]